MSHHLMGAAEIAQRLGVSRQRVSQITSRDTFPRPVIELASGRIWETEAVEAWIAEHRPDRAKGTDAHQA
jgi:prophage regulatory protein